MKTSITHILVPTDFSGFSNLAFRFACNIADRSGAKILLFHVVEPPYNFATAVKGMIEMMEENAQKRMDLLIEDSGHELEISTQIRHGRTSQEIMNCVDSEDIDLVVMGSRGQSALSRAVLGSVTEVIAYKLPVPLFLIPFKEDPDDFDPDASTLIFATDFKEGDPDSFKYAQHFATLLDGKIKPAHFSPTDGFDERIRHAGFTQILREESDDNAIEIERLIGENLLHSLAEFVKKENAFALAFNRYSQNALQKLFYKDHTEEMVIHSKIPMLIIPSGHF